MDAFSCLGLARRPLLEESVLRAAFQARMKEAHPDRAGTEDERASLTRQTEDLNQAYALLRDPRRRIRHLLELEGRSAGRVAALPPDLMQEVMPVAATVKKGQSCLERKMEAETLLERAAMEYEISGLTDSLMEWSGKLDALLKISGDELAEVDARWVAGEPDAGRLEQVDAKRGYLLKWLNETRQILGRLAEG
jgi:hypothetical protein